MSATIERAGDVEFHRRLAEHAGLPFVRLEQDGSGDEAYHPVDAAAATLLSEAVCRHFTMIPISRSADALQVAVPSLTSDLGLQTATAVTGLPSEPVIASREEIERAIDAVFAGARPSLTNGATNGHGAHDAPAAAARLGVRAPLRIGEVLVARGAVPRERIDAALEQQRQSGGRVGDILLHNAWIDEGTLVNVLAQQQELPVVDLREMTPEPGALARLPEPVMRELRCIPIAVDEQTLYLAVDEAPGPEELARLRQYSQLTIRPFLATSSSIDDLLQRLFRTAYIDTATYDMVRRFPDDSANRVITAAQRTALAAALLVVIVAIVLFPIPALIALLGMASVFYAAVSAYKIFLTYEALGHEYELDITSEEVEALDERTLPPYTILVPLYKEAEVIPQLAAGIDELDYPKHLLDVRLLCEEDDLETIETIRELHLPPHFKLVIVPESQPRTKPKACNYGLLHAEGKYCVIYDAEDQPDPDQL
jgi:hypothetical protein